MCGCGAQALFLLTLGSTTARLIRRLFLLHLLGRTLQNSRKWFDWGDRRSIWIYPNAPATIEIWHPQIEIGSVSTSYQRVNTASDYDTVGFPAFAQFDATDDALLFPAITFGGAFNTFVAGKVTGGRKVFIYGALPM